jgi:hypothetical protein
MPLLPNILAQDLVTYFEAKEQTNVQAADAFAHAYVDHYANGMSFIVPGTLNSLTSIISQIIAAVPPSPIPGTWALAVDSALVAFWPAVSGITVPSGVITPTAPGTGAALILGSLTPAALAGTPPSGLAQILSVALDTYTRTFLIAFDTGGTSPLL